MTRKQTLCWQRTVADILGCVVVNTTQERVGICLCHSQQQTQRGIDGLHLGAATLQATASVLCRLRNARRPVDDVSVMRASCARRICRKWLIAWKHSVALNFLPDPPSGISKVNPFNACSCRSELSWTTESAKFKECACVCVCGNRPSVRSARLAFRFSLIPQRRVLLVRIGSSGKSVQLTKAAVSGCHFCW